MKNCKTCLIELTEENHGHGLKCKECYRRYMNQWQKDNRSKVNASHYKWIQKNPLKNRESAYRWREKNKEHYNEYQRTYQAEYKKRKLNDEQLESNNDREMAGNQSGSE